MNFGKITMKILKKQLFISQCLFIVLFTCVAPAPLHAKKNKDSRSFLSEEWEMLEDRDFDAFLSCGSVAKPENCENEEALGIITILKGVGAFKILQQDIFLRTNPLNQRSLLDYP